MTTYFETYQEYKNETTQDLKKSGFDDEYIANFFGGKIGQGGRDEAYWFKCRSVEAKFKDEEIQKYNDEHEEEIHRAGVIYNKYEDEDDESESKIQSKNDNYSGISSHSEEEFQDGESNESGLGIF